MEQNIECKKCGCSISYRPLGANFIIFCPDCKKMMFWNVSMVTAL